MSKASKVWFVTGSSRGIGRGIVEAALAAGDRVVATARRPEVLADLAERYGARVALVPLDVTDEAAAVAAVARAVEAFGGIDVLVNNAGYGDIGTIEDMPMAAFRAQVDANFYGAVHVTRAALPVLRAQGSGHVIQVSTIGARMGNAGLSGYQSAKWALEGFSEVLAAEVAAFGIHVTIVEPGGFRTDWSGASMTRHAWGQAYDATMQPITAMLHAYSGNEIGDPAKAGALVVEIANMPTPPRRILFGTDAVLLANAVARARAAEDAQWRERSVTTDIDSPEARAVLAGLMAQLGATA